MCNGSGIKLLNFGPHWARKTQITEPKRCANHNFARCVRGELCCVWLHFCDCVFRITSTTCFNSAPTGITAHCPSTSQFDANVRQKLNLQESNVRPVVKGVMERSDDPPPSGAKIKSSRLTT